MSAEQASFFRRLTRGLFRAGAKFFRLALWLFLLVQIFLLVGLLRDDVFTLPQAALRLAQERLAAQNVFLSAQRCALTPTGWLVLEDASLYDDARHSEPLLRAGKIAVRPSWSRLLMGNFLPARAYLEDGALHCPSYRSMGGQNTPVLQDIVLQVSQKDGNLWKIEKGFLRIFNLTAGAHGNFYLPQTTHGAPADKDAPATPATPFMRQIADIAAQAQKAEAVLAHFKNPHLKIALRTQGKDTLIEATALADGGQLEPQVHAGAFTLNALMRFDGKTLAPARHVLGNAADLRYTVPAADTAQTPQNVRVGTALLRAVPSGKIEKDIKDTFSDIYLDLFDVEGYDAHIDAAHVHASALPLPLVQADARVRVGEHTVALQVQADIEAKTIQAELSGRVDPRALLPESLLQDPGVRGIQFSNTPEWSLRAVASHDGQAFVFDHATATLRLYETRYESLHLHGAYAIARVDTQGVRTDTLRLWGEGFYIQGAYLQDFDNSSYRFLLRGEIPPHQLDALMESWWQDIWREFDVEGNPPYADIDFGGKWATDIDTKLVGEIRLNDFFFRTARWQNGRVGIRLKPEYTAIDNILLYGEQGTLNGNFRWFYKTDLRPRLMFMQHLSIRSTLGLELLGKVGGEDVELIARELTSEKPPKLSGEFFTWGVGSAVAGENFITLSALIEGPGTVFGIPVAGVALNAQINNRGVQLSDINLGLSGGKMLGTVTLSPTSKGTRADFGFELTDADHERFLDDIARMQTFEEAHSKNAKVFEHPPITDSLDGDMKLTAKGSGIFGHTDTFNGKGAVHIDGADIGKLNLLGGLSRFLENTVLPSGQLHFTHADSGIVMSNGVLIFPEVAITGPTAKVDAAGWLNLADQSLDFNIHFYPLGAMDSSFVQFLMTPTRAVSNVFAVTLNGSSKNPNWSLNISPSRLFTFSKQSPQLPELPAAAQKPALTPISLEKRAN